MQHNPHASLTLSFVIRRLDTAMYKVKPQIPANVSQSSCFLYLQEGELLADLGTEPFLVSAGQFLLIPPGIPFLIKYYNCSVGYMGAFSNEILKSSHFGILHRRQPVIIGIEESEMVFVGELLAKILREFSPVSAPGALLLGTLDLLLELLDSSVGSVKSSSSGNPVCTSFLDRVFDRTRVLEGVSYYASELGVSANHLNRVVKHETGRSAGEWIDVSRLTLAKLLLRQTNMPIIDIAAKAGFEDQSYFSRFFKKHSGMTPSEFRNEDMSKKS